MIDRGGRRGREEVADERMGAEKPRWTGATSRWLHRQTFGR